MIVGMGQYDVSWLSSSFSTELNIITFILVNVLTSRFSVRLKRYNQTSREADNVDKIVGRPVGKIIARTKESVEERTEKIAEDEKSVDVARVLSPAQIEEFQERGVLVIKNFLSCEEVTAARRGE